MSGCSPANCLCQLVNCWDPRTLANTRGWPQIEDSKSPAPTEADLESSRMRTPGSNCPYSLTLSAALSFG